jgi:hypothetical protein
VRVGFRDDADEPMRPVRRFARLMEESRSMRNLLSALALGMLVAATAGCIIPAYSADPARRTEELMYTSENLRLLLDEWERTWLLDQPDHMTPYRTHGGLI